MSCRMSEILHGPKKALSSEAQRKRFSKEKSDKRGKKKREFAGFSHSEAQHFSSARRLMEACDGRMSEIREQALAGRRRRWVLTGSSA